MLYTPYGSVVAELVQTRTRGVRLGVLAADPTGPHAHGKATKRVSDIKAPLTGSTAAGEKKVKDELALCEAIVEAIAPTT